MRKIVLIGILLVLEILSLGTVSAQIATFNNYNWNEKETYPIIPEKYLNKNEVVLDRNIKIELAVEKDIVKQFHLIHEKTFINSDDAIEENNKIYIPLSQDEKLLESKARVILKNGKIILLDNKDIKEEIDEKKGVKYKYFAVSGLEKGAVIETLFKQEQVPDMDGKSIFIQVSVPLAAVNFELILPDYVILKSKSYNGLSNAVSDTITYKDKTIYRISEKDIDPIEDDEKYANIKKHLKLFRYKIDGNINSGARNIYNFKKFATNVYDNYHIPLEKKDQKAIDEFCSSIPKKKDLQEQIWNIEHKIKKTIVYDRYLSSKPTITDVLKSKQANLSDILKLYVEVFKNFSIENNIVFTSNRYNTIFDKEFESYENLSEILFFFPSIKKFITPTEVEYRIPLIPNILAHNYGLFIKEKKFSGVMMGIGEVGFIDIPSSAITHDDMEITIDFETDFENPIVKEKMNFGGYSGLNLQPLKDFASEDVYKKVVKSIAEAYTDQTEFSVLKTSNDGLENIGINPFVLDLEFSGKNLLQKAGNDYLFSIGQIIGKQMELYQENKRILPVELDYPHSYERNITVLLPKGSSIKNLEKLNMNIKCVMNEKTEAEFVSSYTLNGNKLSIKIVENYSTMDYPLIQFDSYKAVVNAAADFNKIVLILNL